MATSTVELNKKCCIKCDGAKLGGGLFTCDGCKKMFCGRHVAEHRQELSIELENTMQEHDLIQQESNQYIQDQTIWDKIDQWEKESIVKIQKTAQSIRNDFRQYQQSTNDRIKTECTELSKSLRIARETDNFSEHDLIKWNKVLTNLKSQLESITTNNIIEDKQSCINLIKVRHHSNKLTNTSREQDTNSTPRTRIITHQIRSDNNQQWDQMYPSFTSLRRTDTMKPNNNSNRSTEWKHQ